MLKDLFFEKVYDKIETVIGKKRLLKILQDVGDELITNEDRRDETVSLVLACFDKSNIRDMAYTVKNANQFTFMDTLYDQVLKKAEIYGIKESYYLENYMNLVQNRLMEEFPEVYQGYLMITATRDNCEKMGIIFDKLEEIGKDTKFLADKQREEENKLYEALTEAMDRYKFGMPYEVSQCVRKDFFGVDEFDWNYEGELELLICERKWKSYLEEELKKLINHLLYFSMDRDMDLSGDIDALRMLSQLEDSYDKKCELGKNLIDRVHHHVDTIVRRSKEGTDKKREHLIFSHIKKVSEILDKKYGNVLFIYGTSGAGKTFIKNSLIQVSLEYTELVVIELSLDGAMDIDSEILRKINRTLNLEFTALSQYHKLFEDMNIRCVFIIDDAHLRGTSIHMMADYIKENTKHSWMYWLLTAHTYQMGTFVLDDNLLDRLSVVDSDCFFEDKGYVNIDEINHVEEVGKQIIRSHFDVEDEPDFVMNSELMDSPLLGQIFIRTCDVIKEEQDIRYLNFSRLLSQWVFNKIQEQWKEIAEVSDQQDVIMDKLDAFIRYLCRISKTSFDYSDSTLPSDKAFMDSLFRLGLIKIDTAYESSPFSETGQKAIGKKVQLSLKRYWLYKIAAHLYQDEDKWSVIRGFAYVDRLEILIHVILMMDQESVHKLDAFFDIVVENNMNEAILYAVDDISDQTKIRIAHRVVTQGLRHDYSVDAKYAFIRYMRLTSNDLISHKKKLEILIPECMDYVEINMVEYYVETINRILYDVPDETTFALCFAELLGISNITVAREVAISTANILRGFYEHRETILSHTKKLITNKDIVKRINNYKDTIDMTGQESTSFLREFLKTLIYQLLRVYNEKVFTDLSDYSLDWLGFDFYETLDSHGKNDYNYVIECIRSATSIVIGNYYRLHASDDSFSEAFCFYMDDLLLSDSPIVKMHVFHYLLNAVDKEENETMDVPPWIDGEIKEKVIQLRDDEQLKQFNESKSRRKFYSRVMSMASDS